MTDAPIKNCSTCGHSTPGGFSQPEMQDKWRFCNLCGDYCKDVNLPIYSNLDWNCKAQNQWVPQPPQPPTLWQQIGKAILARISHGNQP